MVIIMTTGMLPEYCPLSMPHRSKDVLERIGESEIKVKTSHGIYLRSCKSTHQISELGVVLKC